MEEAFDLAKQGRGQEGLELLEAAVEADPSVANLTALGGFLLTAKRESPNFISHMERALDLGQRARAVDTKSYRAQKLITLSAFELTQQTDADRKTWVEFARAANLVQSMDPESASGNFRAAVAASHFGDWTRARRFLNDAEKLGWDEGEVRDLREWMDGEDPIANPLIPWAWWQVLLTLAALWVALLLLMFMVGKYYSRRTLALIRATGIDQMGFESARGLRNRYRRLLSFAGGFYYFSMPFLTLLVAVFTIWFFVVSIRSGSVLELIVLLVITGVATFVSVLATLMALFSDGEWVLAGRALKREEAPDLWLLLDELAAKVDTKPIDRVWISPGADLCVKAEGSIQDRLQGQAPRTLYLGLALLEGFDLNAFKAALLHEYGHYLHGDTAGGEVVTRVVNSIAMTGSTLQEAGLTQLWNLSYGFLILYHKIFENMAVGASRMQEVLADRLAVETFGVAALEEGLVHSLKRNIYLEGSFSWEMGAAQEESRPPNLAYGMWDSTEPDLVAEMDAAIAEIKSAETDETDSHPGFADRIRLAQSIPAADPGLSSGSTAWDLFADPEALLGEFEEMANALACETLAENAPPADIHRD